MRLFGNNKDTKSNRGFYTGPNKRPEPTKVEEDEEEEQTEDDEEEDDSSDYEVGEDNEEEYAVKFCKNLGKEFNGFTEGSDFYMNSEVNRLFRFETLSFDKKLETVKREAYILDCKDGKIYLEN